MNLRNLIISLQSRPEVPSIDSKAIPGSEREFLVGYLHPDPVHIPHISLEVLVLKQRPSVLASSHLVVQVVLT